MAYLTSIHAFSRMHFVLICCIVLSPISSSASVNTKINCELIESIIDSIFDNHLEESFQTRQLTPILYEQVMDQNCKSKYKILTLAGIIYSNDGKYINAKSVLDQADSLVQVQGCNNKICVYTKLIKGLIEMKESNESQALLSFAKAEELSLEFGFYSGQIQALINHALVYNQRNELEKAKEYLFRARELIDKCESVEITGYVFLNLGHTYSKEQNYVEAIANYKKAQEIWSEISFAKGLYYLQNNYAHLEKRQGNLQAFEKHLKKSIVIMEADSIINSSMSYIQLGELYATQDREDEALVYLQKAIAVNDGHDDKEFLRLATNLISLYGKRNNEAKIAEVSQRIEDIYKLKLKNVNNQENKWQQKEFVLESKIIENENLRKLQEEAAYKVRVRNILLSLMTGLLVLVSILLFMWSRSRKLKEQLRLEQLRSKISKDLHDDVGTILAGISFQAQLLETQASSNQKSLIQNITSKSAEAITKMRDMIWAIDARNGTPIDLEFKMKDYLVDAVEGKGITYQFNNSIPENIKGFSSEIKYALYIIFKESIYNILKHSDADNIVINLSHQVDKIQLNIADNGSQKEVKMSGQGLKNMNERAATLNGSFKFFFDDGYQTKLSIPI